MNHMALIMGYKLFRSLHIRHKEQATEVFQSHGCKFNDAVFPICPINKHITVFEWLDNVSTKIMILIYRKKFSLERGQYQEHQSISISPLGETILGRSKNCETNFENFEKWKISTRVLHLYLISDQQKSY